MSVKRQKLNSSQEDHRQVQQPIESNNLIRPDDMSRGKIDDLSSFRNQSNLSDDQVDSDNKSQVMGSISGELSADRLTQLRQRIYLFVNDYESSKLAFFFSFLSIQLITIDIVFLIIETEKSLAVDHNIWVTVNFGISSYFLIEYLLRLFCYNAFDETLSEFFQKPVNIVDVCALGYSAIENVLFLTGININDRIKILRMLIVLRLIRIFKYQTFSKGINILIRGLSESLQALSLLLFFTIICVILISSFMYFAEKELLEDAQIQNIPQAIWWAVITITTVGYGDVVPKSVLGKFIGAVSLIFGVLLLSLPVAIIGNKFQEIYLQNKREETEKARKKAKQHFSSIQNQNEKEIYRIILKLNELEQVNERIEKCLKDNQFLYRSITRDAQNMIDKIELNKDGKKATKNDSKTTLQDRVVKIKEEIRNNKKNK